MSQKPDEYHYTCLKLEFSIRMLEDLNKELPLIMKQYSRKKQKDTQKAWKNLDEKTRLEFEDLNKILFPPIEEVLKTVYVGENGKKYLPPLEIPDSYRKILVKRISSLPMTYMFNDLIREMCLVYLIAQFESLVENFLKTTFNICPKCLASQKKVSMEAIVSKIHSKEEILKTLAEKEVSDVLRSEVDKWDGYFSKKFKIRIATCVPDWNEFKERFYRRNIILHNLGVVNEEYRKKTGYKGKEERLTVSKDYLEKSIDMFRLMGFKLANEFYRKFAMS